MKIVKLKHEQQCNLWRFFKEHLPPSLRATSNDDGYGHQYGIEVKTRGLRSYVPFSDGIATVWDDHVELRHPEYFSDFEDIIRKYEAATGKEVEFRYWESS